MSPSEVSLATLSLGLGLVGNPPAEHLCRPFAEALSLCVHVRAQETRPLLRAELVAHGLSEEQAFAKATEVAKASVGAARPERAAIADMREGYWLSAEGDGLDHAPMLFPEEVKARAGAQARVAVPTPGVWLAWSAGSDELDRVMAVAVARMVEADEQGVTAKVYTWDEPSGAWVVWGQARR